MTRSESTVSTPTFSGNLGLQNFMAVGFCRLRSFLAIFCFSSSVTKLEKRANRTRGPQRY